jgi:hypothetical protein
MEQEANTYRNLQELKGSGYQIVAGEPNVIDWKVNSEAGAYLGEVKDLLFDPQTNAVRYLIIDLTNNGMNLNGKKVMIPMGIANLHVSEAEVILPNIHIDQFNQLPAYGKSEIGPAIEVQIREIIASPAALRLEEIITEFDQDQFYAHQHFAKDRFEQAKNLNENPKIGNAPLMPNRVEEQKTIHGMVQNSLQHDLHAANQQTGVNTHHNEHQNFKDQQD